LASGHAELEQGRYAAAQLAATAVLEESEAFDYAPLRTEGQLLLGTALARADELERGRAVLEDAFLAATEAGDDATAARAARELLCNAGATSNDTGRAQHWARTAAAASERAGVDARDEVELDACLAAFYQRPEERTYAETLLRDALAATDSTWSDGLVEARVRDRLGTVLAVMERFDEARSEHARAYELARAARGPTHPVTLAARGNLARLLNQLGHPGDAVAIHLDNLQVIGTTLGADSPQLLQTHLDLAAALAQAGAAPQAIAYLERGVELARARPDQARKSMLLLSALAYQTWAQGELPRALALYREAVDVAESAYGPQTRQAGIARANLAGTLATSERHRPALAEFLHALAILEHADGPDSARVGTLHTNVARLAIEMGREDLLEQHLAAAERIARSNGDVRLEFAVLWLRVNVLRRDGELTPAREIQARIVEITAKLDPAEHRRALFDLGMIERELGHPKEALTALEQAHALALARNSEPWRLAEIEFELGRAEWLAGRRAQARRWVEQAVNGWRANADDSVGGARADDLASAIAWLDAHR
ncbi:MAG TPA: tetratricopeptide repeat protein, partial [Nannocystaceae bacterium]|nr:tetratricopeptide repeat protein [Nannocystaceae bacterium]